MTRVCVSVLVCWRVELWFSTTRSGARTLYSLQACFQLLLLSTEGRDVKGVIFSELSIVQFVKRNVSFTSFSVIFCFILLAVHPCICPEFTGMKLHSTRCSAHSLFDLERPTHSLCCKLIKTLLNNSAPQPVFLRV